MSNRRRPTGGNRGARPAGPRDEDLAVAAAVLFPRLGATSLEIRFSEPEDDTDRGIETSPVVWMAIATFMGAPPQVAAALSPGLAQVRLLEQLVDGGECQHCHRPTGLTTDIDEQLLGELVCWYQYDPELVVFRRGCA